VPCFQDLWTGNIGMDDIFESVFKHETLEYQEDSSKESICTIDTSSFGMDIEFLDVNFEYPTGPRKPILQAFNLTIPRNSSVAIVGPSGSGKVRFCVR
jgi:ABC-type multidrug transport system fused ATPase/permease subunit